MTVLVIGEHDNAELKAATWNTAGAAAEIGGGIDVLIAGAECGAAAEAAAGISGVARVRVADAPAFAHQLAETLAPLVARLARKYSHVLAPAGTFGKNLVPRAAALLDVQPISDIVGVAAPDTFERPIYAGNAIATVRSGETPILATVRGAAFAAAGAGGGAEIEPVADAAAHAESGAAARSRFIGRALSESARPELTSARVVVSGGRGMGSGDNFALLEALADKLGAAVGASRAAVDAGYVPNDYQVGQTGKIVAPELYIAVGISGAIQHLAGMKESKIIVAINKDAEAPIFQIADYGLAGDLFEIVPALTEALP